MPLVIGTRRLEEEEERQRQEADFQVHILGESKWLQMFYSKNAIDHKDGFTLLHVLMFFDIQLSIAIQGKTILPNKLCLHPWDHFIGLELWGKQPKSGS